MTDNPAPKRTFRSKFLRTLLVMAIVLGSLTGWQAYRNWSELESALAAIRAEGLPVTSSELNTFYSVEDGAVDSTEEWLTAVTNLMSVINKGRDLQIVGINENPVPPPGEEWDELDATRKFLTQASTELALIHTAADRGGQIRFPVDFRAGIATLLTHTQEMRNCARILVLEAHVHAHDGNYAAVEQNVRHLFAMSDALRREPCHVSSLVRIALHSIGCRLIEDMLPYADWNDKQLTAMQSSVNSADFHLDMTRALQGERALALDSCQTMIPFPIRSANVAKFLELYDEWIGASNQDWDSAIEVARAVDGKLVTLRQSAISKYQYIGVLQFAPAVRHCFDAGAQATARQSATACLLAIQRYRLIQNSLPAALSDLPPKYLDQVPIDPYGNTPLKYLKNSETSARVYSVFQNKSDDQADYTRDDRRGTDFGVFYEKRVWPAVEDQTEIEQ